MHAALLAVKGLPGGCVLRVMGWACQEGGSECLLLSCGPSRHWACRVACSPAATLSAVAHSGVLAGHMLLSSQQPAPCMLRHLSLPAADHSAWPLSLLLENIDFRHIREAEGARPEMFLRWVGAALALKGHAQAVLGPLQPCCGRWRASRAGHAAASLRRPRRAARARAQCHCRAVPECLCRAGSEVRTAPRVPPVLCSTPPLPMLPMVCRSVCVEQGALKDIRCHEDCRAAVVTYRSSQAAYSVSAARVPAGGQCCVGGEVCAPPPEEAACCSYLSTHAVRRLRTATHP